MIPVVHNFWLVGLNESCYSASCFCHMFIFFPCTDPILAKHGSRGGCGGELSNFLYIRQRESERESGRRRERGSKVGLMHV